MEANTSQFDRVMQRALDIVREFVANYRPYQENGSAAIAVCKILQEHGMNRTDSERAYAGLKRLGLIEIVRPGHGYAPPIISVEMETSVVTRRAEKEISRKKRTRLTGTDAELAIVEDKIETAKAELRRLQRARLGVLEKIAENKVTASAHEESRSDLVPT